MTIWHGLSLFRLAIGITVLSILVYVALQVRRIRRELAAVRSVSAAAAMHRAEEAHGEARTAHSRIDRIDDDLKVVHADGLLMRAKQAVTQGWVKFVMHRDISDEIKRQAFDEHKGDEP